MLLDRAEQLEAAKGADAPMDEDSDSELILIKSKANRDEECDFNEESDQEAEEDSEESDEV